MWASRQSFRRLQTLESTPSTALLYVTCNDHDLALIEKLCHQDYPELDIYVLDDSQGGSLGRSLDHLPITVVARTTRTGYKAGNLNNWLSKYGANYTYFVVTDADSLLPPNFVSSMVTYANDPANEGVAIFESVITGWNTDSSFARMLDTMRPLENQLATVVQNALGQTLSVGHNNLYRADRIMAGGGFVTHYVAEDYSTSVHLMSQGLGACKVMPVKSFERVPSNLPEFLARQSRWALQTFQLLSLDLSGVDWAPRVRMLESSSHLRGSSRVVSLIASVLPRDSSWRLAYGWFSKPFSRLLRIR